MAIFKKTKLEEARDGEKAKESKLACDRISFDEVIDNDEKTRRYVDMIKTGTPLVLNFEHLTVPEANKILSFLAGACYALHGKAISIDEKVFLFARGEDFLDGSLTEWIKQFK